MLVMNEYLRLKTNVTTLFHNLNPEPNIIQPHYLTNMSVESRDFVSQFSTPSDCLFNFKVKSTQTTIQIEPSVVHSLTLYLINISDDITSTNKVVPLTKPRPCRKYERQTVWEPYLRRPLA